MGKLILCIVLVLTVIYIIPFILYSAASVLVGLEPPEGVSPGHFLMSILVSKIGTAITFVLIFYVARDALSGKWILYAGLWWLMYVIGEIGQTIGPNYSWQEAIIGTISETIYWPLSAFITNSVLINK